MGAKVLQIRMARTTAENFHHTVETVEVSVKFEIASIDDEDGSLRMCQIELSNQDGARGRHCVAFLAREHLDELIDALTAWKALP